MIGGIFVYDGDATSGDAINASGQVTGFPALTSITYLTKHAGNTVRRPRVPIMRFEVIPMNRINGAYGARTQFRHFASLRDFCRKPTVTCALNAEQENG
jgi:hypothetical protein